MFELYNINIEIETQVANPNDGGEGGLLFPSCVALPPLVLLLHLEGLLGLNLHEYFVAIKV